jgi:DNA-binding response OmpR family regulator
MSGAGALCPPILMRVNEAAHAPARLTSRERPRSPIRAQGSAAGEIAQEPRSSGERILIVEDEPGIVDFLQRGLSGAGFEVTCAKDGIEGERLATTESYDAMVLDLLLPGRSGLEIMQSVRRVRPLLPVIILSALGELDDRLTGLEAGAVDYMVKPFSVAELIARLRAQLRAVAHTLATTLSALDIEVDLITRRVMRSGKQVHLSTTELELLIFMIRNAGQVLSREQILSAVWGYEHDPETNIVDVYIGYLRRKLALPDRPAPIQTVRSVGYRLGAVG